MKKIFVITMEKRAVREYVENLRWFFSGLAEVDGVSIKEGGASAKVEADVVLISNQTILQEAKRYLPDSSQVEYVDISFRRRDIHQLEEVPRGTRVLLVDYKEYMAISLAALLNEFGIQHLDFVPWAPGMPPEIARGIETAVTPGLPEFVPPGIGSVIDIGYRKIDIGTINSLAAKLKINDVRLNERMIEYVDDQCHRSQGLAGALRNLKAGKMRLEAVLEGIEDGVIVSDASGLLHCNRFICKLLGRDAGADGLCGPDMHPFCSGLLSAERVENRVMELQDEGIRKDLVVSKKVFRVHDKAESSIIIVKDAEKIQTMEIGIRKSILGKGYAARYTFEDIVYRSARMDVVVERSRKIALIDNTTLIVGETGTGKELFAQALHNRSMRRHGPFVAINCAAISDSLLESELFGYEEGSFTGARKGGKKGLFELAHGGTIFLDELGSISPMMQVKLLRVLQEKEVMRIGGVNLVPVDVRVIAATNDNLELLVAQGTFRRDLYYRINNFTIQLPPLRDRKEDIPVILRSIMEEYKADNVVGAGLSAFLEDYGWGGNVRELRNCVEYMIFMGKRELTLDDLPVYMRVPESCGLSAQEDLGELFGPERLVAEKILKAVRFRGLGRRGLQRLIEEDGYEVSEYRLRWILQYLRDKGLVRFGRGREGVLPGAGALKSDSAPTAR